MKTVRPDSEKIIAGLIRRDPEIERLVYSPVENSTSIFGNVLAAFCKKGASRNPLLKKDGYDDPVAFMTLIYEKLTPEVLCGVKTNFYAYVDTVIDRTLIQLGDPNRHKREPQRLHSRLYLSAPLSGKNNKVVGDIISDTIADIDIKSSDECYADIERCMQAAGLNSIQREVLIAKYEGKTAEDTAKNLGISRANYDTILSRTRKLIKPCYMRML